MSSPTYLLLLLGTLALSGCGASATVQRLPESASPNPDRAYLYGNFGVEHRGMAAKTNARTLAFAFECVDGARYSLRFSSWNPLGVFEIKPAACFLREVEYIGGGGKRPVPWGIRKIIRFEPGKAYYLGDFEAFTQLEFTGGNGGMLTTWKITSAKDEYATTTAALKSDYPAFAPMQTKDAAIGDLTAPGLGF